MRFSVCGSIWSHTLFLFGVKRRMNNSKSSKKLKNYAIFISIAFLLVAIAFALVFHRAGYDKKVLIKLGVIENTNTQNVESQIKAILAWDNCLQKMDYDADIVFFGDSITRDSDFRKYFDEQKIVNLGLGSDTIMGMIDRIPMVVSVKPEKIFLMGGINGLNDDNVDDCAKSYADLLDRLHSALPDAEIIVQSVLPIAFKNETANTNICHNTSIEQFNAKIEEVAAERGIDFIDLYSLYYLNGEMNPSLTRDGVHLHPEAYDLWANAIRSYFG